MDLHDARPGRARRRDDRIEGYSEADRDSAAVATATAPASRGRRGAGTLTRSSAEGLAGSVPSADRSERGFALTTEARPSDRTSHAYDLFILALTLISLGIMVLLVIPQTQATTDLLQFYDNLIAFVFLGDFAWRITHAPSKRRYFIDERGWLDLLGSVPGFGITNYGGLLRLARLSRLARISRLLRGQGQKDLVADVVRNRSQYAAFLTALLAIVVLVVSSILEIEAESHAKGANITTGMDALWWSIVTITTVGYGDFYPITTLGRIVAFFVMLAGVGIIGSLASILASVLVGGSGEEEAMPVAAATPATEDMVLHELTEIRRELAELRAQRAPSAQAAASETA